MTNASATSEKLKETCRTRFVATVNIADKPRKSATIWKRPANAAMSEAIVTTITITTTTAANLAKITTRADNVARHVPGFVVFGRAAFPDLLGLAFTHG
jgi:hypothetical protein